MTSLVDERRVLGGLSAPQIDEGERDRAMRGEDGIPGCSPCTLPAELVAWARAEPTGGFARCVCGRAVFVPPESCLERIEPDAAHVVIDHTAR